MEFGAPIFAGILWLQVMWPTRKPQIPQTSPQDQKHWYKWKKDQIYWFRNALGSTKQACRPQKEEDKKGKDEI
uniref:Secreted protein n=1 Tax=Steinernema glaseri TaxID=37863 RepID=A0A1I7Z4G1_9BILA